MATGGGHAKLPPGRKPDAPQSPADATEGQRGRKKEKQRARRVSADPSPRASSPAQRSVPAASSAPSDNEFLRQLQQQYGKKQAKRAFREQQNAAPSTAAKRQHTSSEPADAAGNSSAAVGTSAAAAARKSALDAASIPAVDGTSAGPSAAAASTHGTEDFHTCNDMEDSATDESTSHSSDSSPPVSGASAEPTITVTLSQLSDLVSNAVVKALPGILPQLASVISPSRSADEPKVKYADPEIYTGAKGQDAETWYEDAKGLYAQRPPALKKMEFQRWLLNRVSEPIRTAFRAHVKDSLQVDYQEVQD